MIKQLATIRSARFTERRMNNVLKEFGYTSDDYKTKALIGFVSPDDFLKATTTPDLLADIEQEAKDLDVDILAEESQLITLYGSLSGNKFRVYNHEGRHRMVGFKRAGVGLIPVIFRVESPARLEQFDDLTVIGQKLDEGQGKNFKVKSVTPVSWDSAIKGNLRTDFQANVNFSGITF